MTNELERLSYTVKEATVVTGLNRTAFYQAIADGALQTFKSGRRRMVSAKALQDYIERLERQTASAA